MKVILVQDVENLGEEGDVQDVADGYGRNYLIPKQFAVPYTKANQAMLESRRSAIEQRKDEKRKTALGLKQRLEEEEIVIQRPAGDSGKLFGSVTSAAVAEELERRGINVERKRIEIPEKNIKMIGTYPVRVKLYDNESAEIKIKIQPSESAEEAAPKGKAGKKPADKKPGEEKLVEDKSVGEKPDEEKAIEEAAIEEAADQDAAEESIEEAPEEGSKEPSAEQIIAEAVTEEVVTEETATEEAVTEEAVTEEESVEEETEEE